MARFLSEKELYPLVQRKSAEAKERMWVCTPYLGSGAHQIFSQDVTRFPPKDIRFVFKLNQNSVERHEVDPLEMEYFLQHFRNSSIRVDNTFHSKIFIFDNSALVTSANLSKTAFGKTIEAGVLLQHNQAEKAKQFFERLWKEAKRVPNLNKHKTIWNATNSKWEIHGYQEHVSKPKPHTKISFWNNDNASSWLFVVSKHMSDRTEKIIEKETELERNGDIV